MILGGVFPLTSPNQNIGGCVPGIPGGVDASANTHSTALAVRDVVVVSAVITERPFGSLILQDLAIQEASIEQLYSPFTQHYTQRKTQ